jgi:hypothetical protein
MEFFGVDEFTASFRTWPWRTEKKKNIEHFFCFHDVIPIIKNKQNPVNKTKDKHPIKSKPKSYHITVQNKTRVVKTEAF